MRVEQPEGQRGSLKWIQRAVETHSVALEPSALGPIHWVSPLRDDAFAEYRDGAFLRRLNLSWLEKDLIEFWPRRGPQWDALGLAGDKVVLVEAKARVPEFMSSPCQASAGSLRKIEAAFDRVKDDLGVASRLDWTQTYYQYANRIAHLWWLRRSGVDVHLLFVDFLNATDVTGPEDVAIWQEAYGTAERQLGLPLHHPLSAFMHHVYPDVARLTQP